MTGLPSGAETLTFSGERTPRMDSFDFGRLLYLVLLGTAIAGYFLAEGRQVGIRQMGDTARVLTP